MRAQAIIQTENARRYLGQFCKHFAHKLPVDLAADNTAGIVTFGAGTCTMAADPSVLTLTVAGETAEAMATLRDVVERHLVRFAFREEIAPEWRQAVS
jgi:hypothetical protein